MKSPDPVFQNLLTSLQAHAAALGRGERVWYVPPRLAGNPGEAASGHAPFERGDLNGAVEESLAGGSVGDHAAAKLQLDYVGALERSQALRHQGPCRAAAHAAARRRGHGEGAGVFLGEVLQYVQNLSASGG